MSDDQDIDEYITEPSENIIDSDLLIAEVEKRPALYNKKLKLYSDRNLKEKLWGEVCTAVVPNFNLLPGKDKQSKGKEVRKKWKNFKDCFSRELAKQKGCTSGQAAKKRRKYVHFDALLFLIPCIENRPTTSNISTPLETFPRPGQNEVEASVDTSRQRITARKTSSNPTSYESSLLSILQDKKNEENDEDKHFALMLVPMFKKLNDEQKHYAKIEILDVMRNARRRATLYHQPTPITHSRAHASQQAYNNVQDNMSYTRNQEPMHNSSSEMHNARSYFTNVSPQNSSECSNIDSMTSAGSCDNIYEYLSNQ